MKRTQHIISVSNASGGVGATTLCIGMARLLRPHGYVAIVDSNQETSVIAGGVMEGIDVFDASEAFDMGDYAYIILDNAFDYDRPDDYEGAQHIVVGTCGRVGGQFIEIVDEEMMRQSINYGLVLSVPEHKAPFVDPDNYINYITTLAMSDKVEMSIEMGLLRGLHSLPSPIEDAARDALEWMGLPNSATSWITNSPRTIMADGGWGSIYQPKSRRLR